MLLSHVTIFIYIYDHTKYNTIMKRTVLLFLLTAVAAQENNCPQDTFSVVGSSVCAACPIGSSAAAGSSACIATAGYYEMRLSQSGWEATEEHQMAEADLS